MSDSTNGTPEGVAGSEVAADALEHDAWTDDAFSEDPVVNLFTDEIENVSATDWDVDADLIWDGVGDIAITDEGTAASEFDLPF